MSISRRGFLKGLLGSGVILGAPAIVRSSSLMKIFVPSQALILPSALNFGNMSWSPEVIRLQPMLRSSFSESFSIHRGFSDL